MLPKKERFFEKSGSGINRMKFLKDMRKIYR